MTTPQPNASFMELTRWVLSLGLKRWGRLSATAGATLLKAGIDALKPWPLLFLVDYVLQKKPMPPWAVQLAQALPGGSTPENQIGWCVAATVAGFLLSWALGLAVTYLGVSLGQRLVYDLAAKVYARLSQLSLRMHGRMSVGDNIRRVTSDCSCVSVILKDALLPLANAAASLLVMAWILWRVDASLALMAMAVVPWMVWVLRRHARPMLDLGYAQQQVEMRIYQLVERTFASIPAVQAFCRETSNDREFSTAANETIRATLDLTRVQLRFKILIGLGTAAGTAAILWFGSRQALSGQLSMGSMLLFLSYLTAFYEPLVSVMYTGAVIESAGGSARRVLEVLHAHQEVQDRPNARPLRRVTGEVRFDDVHYGYEPGRPVLRGVSLQARPGDCIALVGASGAGKSTLASLIPRFFDPWQGRVLMDGCDVREFRLKSLRRHVGLVLQEPFLFPMSVAENIAYGRPRATMREIENAARTARAHEFILQLPQGYRTLVGERGATLSVGQRQRLSMARALLKRAPILILDEPTSALDAETEQALLAALEPLLARRTTFIIAHRLSTVRRASRIVFLKDGVVAESGTHDELLARDGLYAAFCAAQFGVEHCPSKGPS